MDSHRAARAVSDSALSSQFCFNRTTTCSLLLLRDHRRRLQMAFWRSCAESFHIARIGYAKFAMLPTAVAAVCANTDHMRPAAICSAREATPRTSTINNPCHNVPNSGQRPARIQCFLQMPFQRQAPPRKAHPACQCGAAPAPQLRMLRASAGGPLLPGRSTGCSRRGLTRAWPLQGRQRRPY